MSHAPARIAKSGSKGQTQTTFVTKWSLDDAAPSEDAIRVRNNQRRHRERVKTYIADLEAKVAALEADLRSSNHHIEKLTRENEDLRRAKEHPPTAHPHPPPTVQPTVSPKALRPLNQASDALTTTEKSKSIRFCCRISPGDKTDDEISDGEELPAPQEGESTTNCETAYRILEQQSAGKLDTAKAEQFLRPGYRRALRQGDGCRVQTQLVYGLLDHITS
jgi:hypothetical protein